MAQLPKLMGFGAGLGKPDKAKGFQQIIHCIELETFHRMLGVSRRKYDHGLIISQQGSKFHPRNVGHLDVQKYKVHFILLKKFNGFKCVRVSFLKIQETDFGSVALDHFQSQRFIIYSYGSQHVYFNWMDKCTKYSSSFSRMINSCRSG